MCFVNTTYSFRIELNLSPGSLVPSGPCWFQYWYRGGVTCRQGTS
jgi:hypothetical protein